MKSTGEILTASELRKVVNGEMPYPEESAEHRAERLAQAEQNAADAEMKRTLDAAKAHESAWAATCPPIYRETDIDRLPDISACMRVLAWQYGERGMILTGDSRAGKTRSCWLLLRGLFDGGRTIRAFDGIGWFFAVGSAFRDMEHAERWLDSLTRVDVLFFDDIFRGRMTDAQDMALWGVIERRMASRKPMIVTTNATGASLEARCGPSVIPIIARLRECCEVVTFKTAMEGR